MQEKHDAKDYGKESNRDDTKRSRENINSGSIEKCKDRSSDKANALAHHRQQGEGGAHLVVFDELGHDRVGDLLDRPVESEEEAGPEEVGEGGAKGDQDHGQ